MLRLAELALFLVPLLTYFVWRATEAAGGPSTRALIAAGIVLAALALLVFRLSVSERMDPGQAYIPPHIEGGRIIPGHVARP